MYSLDIGTAITIPIFAHDATGDPVTGKVTSDWTTRIRKTGSAWAAMTATVTETEGGWYDLAVSSAHTDTPGLLTIYLSAPGVKQINLQWKVENNIATAVLVTAGITEPTGPPSFPMSLATVLGWIGVLARNKLTQTNTVQTVYNDLGVPIATSVHSDDGVTHIREEFS